jgi:putative transposase
MSRRPRLQFAGAVYHVMARGNRKSTIFDDDEDRRQFLQVVGRAASLYDLRIMAICLMGNHYHFILETPGRNLSDAMQFINGVFAQRSNRRHGQTGHVFEGRFRSLVIHQESYLMRAARYVVRNPVRAGLVTDAGAWPWSSYRATAGLQRVPDWLHVGWIQWAFKANSRAEARRRYIRYVNAPAESQRPVALNAVVLGTRQFGKRLRRVFGADQPDRHVPRAIRPLVRPALGELFDGVRISASRDRLIYNAHVVHGYRFAEIARYLGIDRSTASKAASRLLSTSAEGGGLAS